MKRTVCALAMVLVLLCSMVSCAGATEIDLSGMSFDELLQLKEEINMQLWKSDKWQSVTVPAGVYLIGRDIPAGTWTISASEGASLTVKQGNKLSETGNTIEYSYGCVYESESIKSPSNWIYSEGDQTSVSWTLVNGYYIELSGTAIFEPYTGVSLGFK